jgi:hypothetical protein
MKIRLWPLLALLISSAVLFPSAAVFGADKKKEEKESHYESGISPDGRTEITLLARPGKYGDVEIDLKFKEVKSGRVLGSFPFNGFSFARDSYKRFAFSPDDLECSWQSDGRCVALFYVMTRGASGTTLYTFHGNRWVSLELPDFYRQLRKFCREAGEEHVVIYDDAPAKGHERFIGWLPHHRFQLEAAYRNYEVPGQEAAKSFWLTFRVVKVAGKSKPEIVLKKIEFAPNAAHEAH